MGIAIVLTPRELIECHKHPDILRSLAHHHDCCATAVDAIGDFKETVALHEARAKELLAEAARIEAGY